MRSDRHRDLAEQLAGAKILHPSGNALQNVYLSLINAGIDLLLRWAFYVGILMWCYNHHFVTIEHAFAYWFLLFILEDLAFLFRAPYRPLLPDLLGRSYHPSFVRRIQPHHGFRSSVFQPVLPFPLFHTHSPAGFHPIDIVFMFHPQTYGISFSISKNAGLV